MTNPLKAFRSEHLGLTNVQRRIMVGALCAFAVLLLVSCSIPSTTQHSPTAKPTTPAIAPTVPVPTSTPSPESGSVPASRSVPQIAYDGKTGTFLLFGGIGFNGNLNDTWTWNGTTWTQQHPATEPLPRSGASMAYDAATSQMVLFGGYAAGSNGTQILGDTWTWDGTTWTQQHSVLSPPARLDAGMTYDAATRTVVLFGGGGAGPRVNRSFPPLHDTWIWNGTTWKQHYPITVPSARLDASIAYDGATQTVVLFGGYTAGSNSLQILGDTWTWNGTTWTQQHPATSPATSFTSAGVALTLSGTSMTYDEATQQIELMLAGTDDSGSHKAQVSWTWDGTTWVQQSTHGPNEDETFLVYGTTQQAVFEFTSSLPHTGGFSDKLWQWTGQEWKELASWS